MSAGALDEPAGPTGPDQPDAPLPEEYPPRLPVSVGALLTDGTGRLLVLKPTYKSGWTVPGGQMEADGETPWDACRREVAEECSLVVTTGRLVCVDFLRPRPGHAGGLRILFDCGRIPEPDLSGIVVATGEIAEYRFADEEEADRLLRPALRRRVRAVRRASGVVYLEEGRQVPSVAG